MILHQEMSDCTCTNCVFITDGRSYWDMDLKTHIALELHCEKHTKRRFKMSKLRAEKVSKLIHDSTLPEGLPEGFENE